MISEAAATATTRMGVQSDMGRLVAERDEKEHQRAAAEIECKSLLVELWEGVRAHGLTAPTKGRDGERLIHAYCGGYVRMMQERDAALADVARLKAERDEARGKALEAVTRFDALEVSECGSKKDPWWRFCPMEDDDWQALCEAMDALAAPAAPAAKGGA
jgi:uncharacterized small protein (DUF1192 family)